MRLYESPSRAERVPVQVTVEVVVDGELYQAELVNLSLSGGFLEASFPIGAQVELRLSLPVGEPVRLVGHVVREGWCPKFIERPGVDNLVIRALGIGIAFDELEDADSWRLQDYLELVSARC